MLRFLKETIIIQILNNMCEPGTEEYRRHYGHDGLGNRQKTTATTKEEKTTKFKRPAPKKSPKTAGEGEPVLS